MKNILLIFSMLIMGNCFGQNKAHCKLCSMDVKDQKHLAVIINAEGESFGFDAVECLINYLKEHNELEYPSIQVADYETGDLIDAQEATYLKSQSIPSPMGAYLSAFVSEAAAKRYVKDGEDKVYDWTAIKELFANSAFGAVHSHHHHNHSSAIGYAPIGVMGDHTHHSGGLMLSYRYMTMHMDGNRSGTGTITDESVHEKYMVAPQKMHMSMHMIGAMYGISDRLTVMAMQNLATNEMDLKARMMRDGTVRFVDFSTKSGLGLGDLKVNALYNLHNSQSWSILVNGGVLIPVGDIQQRADTPMRKDMKLPYVMQLGSGTLDFLLGATVKGSTDNIAWGIQLLGTIRSGMSEFDYRYGNTQQVNLWTSVGLLDELSISARIHGKNEGDLTGKDPMLNPRMVTTADTQNYGGQKLKTYIGANAILVEGLNIGVEAGIPIYQNLHGIQMDERLCIQLGLRYVLI